MTLDREKTLRKAERFLRQGRLESAIAEYVRLVEAQPRDWATANALGDLYVRTAQLDRAVSQFARIADQLFCEGFLPKAAALYKKILKIAPDDEAAQLQLAEVSARQGLLVNARTYLSAVAEQRRRRGDRAGADAVLQRMASIDPADLDGRVSAVKLIAESGDATGVDQLRATASELEQQGRQADAIDLLRDVTRFDPSDVTSQARIARACLADGSIDIARAHLTPEVAGNDPTLLVALAEVELRSGDIGRARAAMRRALDEDVAARAPVERLGLSFRRENLEAAFACTEAVADSACASGDFQHAIETLRDFIGFAPAHEPALVRLIEVCLEGDREAEMATAQAALADICLARERAGDARVIVDDLLGASPASIENLERRRRILEALGEFPAPVGASPSGPVAPGANPSYTAPDDRLSDDPLDVSGLELLEVPAVELDLTEQLAVLADDEPGLLAETLEASAEPEPVSIPEHGPIEEPVERPRALGGVFQGFRDEVTRHRSEEVAAQQYKLAVAYHEMGMLEEATAALQIAARSPHLRFTSASMLADIYFERQMPAAAIEWLERAAETPPSSASEGQALLYKLGSTLASLGEPARALAVFLELQADEGEYRDVAKRVEELSRVQAGG